MRDHLEQSGKFFGCLLCVPFMIGLVGAWNDGLGFALILFGLPVLAIAFVGGGLIYIARGAMAVPEIATITERLAVALAAPAMAVATLALASPILAGGRCFGSVSRLLVNYSAYEAIIAGARHPGPGETGQYRRERNGITYIVDAGPPLRVAFNPAGLLDNWSGIVFDPSGERWCGPMASMRRPVNFARPIGSPSCSAAI